MEAQQAEGEHQKACKLASSALADGKRCQGTVAARVLRVLGRAGAGHQVRRDAQRPAAQPLGLGQLAPVARGTLQGHWPEVNVLIDPTRCDPLAMVPDYNCVVTVRKA